MKEKIIFTNGLIDLAQPRLGTKVIYKTDDFFASANRIISPTIPVFKDGVFDKHGKWMDGWESRRKRFSGHDYIILKLGKPGKISKIDVDTSHFNGNQPSMISIEACNSKPTPTQTVPAIKAAAAGLGKPINIAGLSFSPLLALNLANRRAVEAA